MTVQTEEALDRAADAATKEESAGADETAEVRVHEDHTRELRTPGFSRMRVDWHGADRTHMESLRNIVDGRILHLFPDAFAVMSDLWDIVRDPSCDPVTGEVLTDRHGFVVWARSESGAYAEDYSRLGSREREDLLFRITTNLFEWKQRSADLWGEAMFAKAVWEESFSTGFVSGTGRLTVDDRTNRARSHATEERYFAIFQSLLSRKADAIVSSLELLSQRLKDVLTM